MSEERLQKVLARAGVASRRGAEALIASGRVKVDGRVVSELGIKVDPRRARIDLDGRRLVAEPLVYVMLHKPRGVMCTLSDPEGRPTVAELLKDVGVRVVPVGRLDFHTSGALLCTNDGEFAGKLLHPRGGVPKEYVAKVRGLVDDEALERWRESIEIEGRATRPAEVNLLRHEGDKSWLAIVLREGKNRQVRRLGEATGFGVLRLARVAHAGVTTEGLRPGQWRHLSRDELVDLKKAYGVPRSVRGADPDALARRSKPVLRTVNRASAGKPGAPRRPAPVRDEKSLRSAGRSEASARPTGREAFPPAGAQGAPFKRGQTATREERTRKPERRSSRAAESAPRDAPRKASSRDGRGPSRPRGTSR